MHIKHPKLERPELEGLATRAISLVGTPCSRIEEVVRTLSEQLGPQYRVICVDADHNKKVQDIETRQEERIMTFPPATGEQWFQDKLVGQYFDVALVNGNHYPSPHQIVFLDSKKEDSLKRREDQLTDVLAYVSVDSQGFDWLEMNRDAPIYELDQVGQLGVEIDKWLRSSKPDLRALILAGGESQRMGKDKSKLEYHGQPQEVFLAKICESLGLTVSISKRNAKVEDIAGFPVIEDSFLGLGPYGAILSAFKEYRRESILVLACDLPFIDKRTIERLIAERSTSKFMTALKAKGKSFAEPLAAIFEPRMYPRMLHALGVGYNCPTKLLRNTDIKSVEVEDKLVSNVNTQEEYREAKEELS